MTWTNVQPEEILFGVIAALGLAVWLVNHREAVRTLRAAETIGLTNGRLLWARFSAWWLATPFVVMEALFLATAITAGFRPPNTGGSESGRLFIIVALSLASALLTFVGVGWYRTHKRMVGEQDGRDERRDKTRDHDRDKARDPVRDVGRDVKRDVPRDVQRDVQRDVPRDVQRDSEHDAEPV